MLEFAHFITELEIARARQIAYELYSENRFTRR